MTVLMKKLFLVCLALQALALSASANVYDWESVYDAYTVECEYGEGQRVQLEYDHGRFRAGHVVDGQPRLGPTSFEWDREAHVRTFAFRIHTRKRVSGGGILHAWDITWVRFNSTFPLSSEVILERRESTQGFDTLGFVPPGQLVKHERLPAVCKQIR